MAKAKKLPSGQWRTLVYDYTDIDGKRHYESFTADTKKESEYLAAQFAFDKKQRSKPADMTLSQAIDRYVEKYPTLSPTTVQGYKTIQKYGYQDLMDRPLKKITEDLLQEAVNKECNRRSRSTKSKGEFISSKTVVNGYGLIATVLHEFYPSLEFNVKLPVVVSTVHELSTPDVIFNLVKDTEIELPVLLAMWLSFTISEIKGLTKSGSIKGNLLYIDKVVVTVSNKEISKKNAKNTTRNRIHVIPEYIMDLINKVETDQLVTMSAKAVSNRFTYMLKKNNLPHMSFHDLRHVNASVMSILNIPDKYAMERGGWKTDKIMKSTYMQTFKPERAAVDKKIDEYFSKTVLEPTSIQVEYENKYKSWLVLFDKNDCPNSRDEFKNFFKCNTKCNTN